MAKKAPDLTHPYFLKSGQLRPPADLPASALALWDSIMGTTPQEQWRPADVPLLALYCRTAALAAEALEHLERDGQVNAVGSKVSPWARIAADHARTLAALAGKLRLCPSSRTRPEAHSLQQRPALSRKPWERTALDDDLIAR